MTWPKNRHNSLKIVVQYKGWYDAKVRMLVPWKLRFYQLSPEVLIKQLPSKSSGLEVFCGFIHKVSR